MRFVYFTHSLASCWNHGNAHFVRGVLSELVARGHDVRAFAPENSWSLTNLLADHGAEATDAYRAAYPELGSVSYPADADLAPLVEGADVVVVHEWNEPRVVAELGRLRRQGGRFTLLFHDTHHRIVSLPHEMDAYDLSGYDGVLAFGETLSAMYRRRGWNGRVWTWHEAADIRRFHPPRAEWDDLPTVRAALVEALSSSASAGPNKNDPSTGSGRTAEDGRDGLVWIGNWGDGERSEEIERFLLAPARGAGLPLDIHGVRYPAAAQEIVARYGARYHGWTANAAAPALFARYLATIHVPRRYYTTILPGIPTIRVFEALACGIPLVSAPWDDAEHLFTAGADYLTARDGAEMTAHLKMLRDDPDLRRELVGHGLETILARHTCAHRVDELMAVLADLGTIVTASTRQAA